VKVKTKDTRGADIGTVLNMDSEAITNSDRTNRERKNH
jgi:hypothetical protein